MNIAKYVKKDMCYQCGACQIACPVDAIEMQLSKAKGLLLPLIDINKCVECGKCIKNCPISKIHAPKEEKGFKENFIFKSTVKFIFEKSPSGGVVSSIVKFLFENKIITKAIGIKSIDGKTVGKLASNFEEFLELGGSKYQPATPIPALKDLKKDDKIVFIGLPCHIRAVDSLIKNGIISRNQIVLKIGLFCTIGRGQYGVQYILDKNKIQPGEIKFRLGEHPQDMIINDRKVCSSSEFLSYNDYLTYPRGCYVCNDLFNVDSDIAVGDAWGMNLGRCGATISHNSVGTKILKECIEKNYLSLVKTASKEEIINTQKESYIFKIKNFKKRMSLMTKVLTKLGIDYTGEVKYFGSLINKLSNRLLLINSRIFNSKLGYKVRVLMPNKIIINLYRNKIILRNLHKED